MDGRGACLRRMPGQRARRDWRRRLPQAASRGAAGQSCRHGHRFPGTGRRGSTCFSLLPVRQGTSQTPPCLKGRSRFQPSPSSSAAMQGPLETAARCHGPEGSAGPGAASRRRQRAGARLAAPRVCPQLRLLLPTSPSETRLASAVTHLAPAGQRGAISTRLAPWHWGLQPLSRLPE